MADPQQADDTRPRRGFWLALYLVIQMILLMMDLQFALGFLNDPSALDGVMAHSSPTPVWAIWVWVSFDAGRFLAISAVWFWSKAGVASFAMLTMVEIALHFYHAGTSDFLGLLAPAILIALIYPQWDRMHWGLVGPRSEKVSNQAIPPPLR